MLYHDVFLSENKISYIWKWNLSHPALVITPITPLQPFFTVTELEHQWTRPPCLSWCIYSAGTCWGRASYHFPKSYQKLLTQLCHNSLSLSLSLWMTLALYCVIVTLKRLTVLLLLRRWPSRMSRKRTRCSLNSEPSSSRRTCPRSSFRKWPTGCFSCR